MRTKRAIINFITDAIPQVIILILGIIKIKLLIIKENIAMQNNRKRDYYEEKNSSTVSRNWLYL